MRHNVSRIAIILIIFEVWSVGSIHTCDACGLSSSQLGMGLATSYQANTIGITYGHQRFRASPSIGTNTQDIFRSLQLSLSQKLWQKAQVQLGIPYIYNKRKYGEGHQTQNGIGDINAIINYTIFDTLTIGPGNFDLDVGIGIRVPTGRFDERIYLQNLPENFNVGRGSYGTLLQTRYTYSLANYGLIGALSYEINSTSRNDYSYGDSFLGAIQGYYEHTSIARVGYTLLAGIQYEHIQSDQYPHGRPPHPTGGEGTYAIVGIQLAYDRFQLAANFSSPKYDHYAKQEVEAQNRFSISLQYFL